MDSTQLKVSTVKTEINIAKREEALNILRDFKENMFINKPIKLINIHIKTLNSILKENIFIRDNCYIDSQTLWEIMQPLGKKTCHNSHNLSEIEVFNVLKNIKNPINVVKSYFNRFLIITIATEINGYHLCAVIEPNTYNVILEKVINKIITIHPIEIKM